MSRRVRFEKPKLPVYIDRWSCYCPACNAIDFNHEHRELPDYPLIDSGTIEFVTAAEHNWIMAHVATDSIGLGSMYPCLDLGFVDDSAHFGLKAVS